MRFIGCYYHLIALFFPQKTEILLCLHSYYRPDMVSDKTFFSFFSIFLRSLPINRIMESQGGGRNAVTWKEARGIYRDRQRYRHSDYICGGRFKTRHRRSQRSPHCSGGGL